MASRPEKRVAREIDRKKHRPRGKYMLSTQEAEFERTLETGQKANERLQKLMGDDTAFGPDGWLTGKEQLAVIDSALNRAYGKPENIRVEKHEGTVTVDLVESMRPVYDMLALPERKRAKKANDRSTPIIEGDVVNNG